jgi:hypothetical protein
LIEQFDDSFDLSTLFITIIAAAAANDILSYLVARTAFLRALDAATVKGRTAIHTTGPVRYLIL